MRLIPIFLLLLLSLGTAQTPLQPANAARAWQDFTRVYWDANRQYFFAYSDRQSRGGVGPKSGTYADFWWEAQLWDLTMDAVEQGYANKIMIDDVYNGFVKEYPDWYNDFNDDLGWWALAATRAYKITGQPRYLEQAKKLFDDIWTYWDEIYGGGVWWTRRGERQKNVATNAPLVAIAVRLYQVTNDKKYLEAAEKTWVWLETKLFKFPRVFDNIVGTGEVRMWDFTYNFGNAVVAALALYDLKKDEQYLEKAKLAADWVLTNLTNSQVLLNEGDGDGGGFKGVFVRRLHDLAVTTQEPKYWQALQNNAISVWNARRSDGLTGQDWLAPTPEGRPLQVLAVASAMAALVNAKPPFEARAAVGNGIYEAENSEMLGVQPSINAAGFTARGYVNRFYRRGQMVVFRVAVAKTAMYQLTLRYSAGGGAATRTIQTTTTQSIDLPATKNWLEWQESSIKVQLPQGFSEIRVAFEDGKNRGYLNLDHLRLTELP